MSVETSSTQGVIAVVRRGLLAILVLGLVGTEIELFLLKHTDGFWQIAPLALNYLGLDITQLSGATAEKTAPLPGVLDGPPYFVANPTANPTPTTVGTSVSFKALASSPAGLPLTYTWNFNDPASTDEIAATNTANRCQAGAVRPAGIGVSQRPRPSTNGKACLMITKG